MTQLGRLGILFAFVATGCTGTSHQIGMDDGGTGGDGGPGVTCGSTTCAPGLVCCNASCGICTEPGEGCIAIACVEDGGAPDASGCVECPAPPEGCRYARASCATCGMLVCGSCGGWSGATCADDEYCDFGDTGTHSCDYDDGTGVCKPRPEGCGHDCPGVCGCDGETYCNECEAATAGIDVLHAGPCSATGDCDAMDAHGTGACDAFFGWAWNGISCYGISGCSCEGTDCASTYETMEECEAAHDHCAGETCGTIAGLTCGSDEWCDYHDTGCGFADGAGTCRPRPDACTEEYAPVCGCDGTTYSNVCHAHGAGVDVQHSGECDSDS